MLNSGGPNDFINNNNSYLVESFIDLKNKIKNIVKNPKKFNRSKMNNFIYSRFNEKNLIKKYNKLFKQII